MERSITWPEGFIQTMKLEGFLFLALVLISLRREAGTSTGVALRKRFKSRRVLKYWMVIYTFTSFLWQWGRRCRDCLIFHLTMIPAGQQVRDQWRLWAFVCAEQRTVLRHCREPPRSAARGEHDGA